MNWIIPLIPLFPLTGALLGVLTLIWGMQDARIEEGAQIATAITLIGYVFGHAVERVFGE